MSVAGPPRAAANRATLLAALFMLAVAVTVAVGAYAAVHEPAQRALVTLGFSGMLQMKTWLTTAALLLVAVQLVTALWMWGRLPGVGRPKKQVALLHRWSGSFAFVLTLPPAFHCIWAVGFASDSPRVLAHGVVGCLFYGAYAAKMLGLRLRGLPGWAVPVLGSLVFTTFVLVWLTSALWFFARSGLPLT